MVATSLVYPVFLFATLIFSLLLIPQKKYREYLMYGFLVGGFIDVVAVMLLQNLLGIIWFKNQGVFYVLGHHALSPLGWTLAVMLFLYFIPRRRSFLYFYIVSWSFLSIGFGYIAQNADLFDFQDWYYPIPALITFVIRWIFAAWLFNKTSSIANSTF